MTGYIEHAPHTAGKEQNKAEINWWRPHSGGMTVYLKREKNIQLLCYNSLWHWAFGHLSHKPENQQQPEQPQQITFCIPHQHNWGQKVKWVQNATILNLICPISIILMATKGGRQQGITFTVHFKSSSWQINWVLYKKKKKNLVHWTSFGMVTRPRSIVLVEFVTSPGHIIEEYLYLNVFIFLVI